MKLFTFFLFFAFILSSQTILSGQNAEQALKQVLQSRTNDIFNRWDDQWSADQYIDESATISYFEESTYSKNTLIAHGTFTVKRTLFFTTRLNVKFTCKVSINSSGGTIVNVCYDDSSSDMKDCCDPAKWKLDSLQ